MQKHKAWCMVGCMSVCAYHIHMFIWICGTCRYIHMKMCTLYVCTYVFCICMCICTYLLDVYICMWVCPFIPFIIRNAMPLCLQSIEIGLHSRLPNRQRTDGWPNRPAYTTVAWQRKTQESKKNTSEHATRQLKLRDWQRTNNDCACRGWQATKEGSEDRDLWNQPRNGRPRWKEKNRKPNKHMRTQWKKQPKYLNTT